MCTWRDNHYQDNHYEDNHYQDNHNQDNHYQDIRFTIVWHTWPGRTSSVSLFLPSPVSLRFFSRRVGLNIAAVLETAQACQKALYPEARETSLRYIVLQVDGYLRRQKRATSHEGDRRCASAKRILARNCCWFFARFYGNYLCCAYLLVKVWRCPLDMHVLIGHNNVHKF